MKKMLFVFNPNSGKAQIKNSLLRIIQIFSLAGYEVTVYPTKAPKDGYNHILENEGKYDVIACSGGDGTLNETVGAILKYSGDNPAIGYIPSGTTNDFATSLHIPKDMVKAAGYIADGERFSCDIGIMNNERSFNYVAAFGAFTEVSYATPQNLKNILGHQAYVIEGVKRLADVKPYRMKVICDELKTEDDFIYGMISNTESVGGMKGLTGTGVDLQDGLFEVMLIKKIKGALDIQSLVSAFVSQNFDKCDMVYSFKTKNIRFESKEKVSWTLDGEYGGDHTDICFNVKESAVDFLIKKRKKKM